MRSRHFLVVLHLAGWLMMVATGCKLLNQTPSHSGAPERVAEPQRAGTVEGRFLWPDGAPITNATIRLVDKVKVYLGSSEKQKSPDIGVQKVAIAEDATLRETAVDSQGAFKFTAVPPGTYYLYYQIPNSIEGPHWAYVYPEPPPRVLSLAGSMEKPTPYRVTDGSTLWIPDISVVRLVERTDLAFELDERGVFTVTWPKSEVEGVWRLTLRHTHYSGSLGHLAYKTNEVVGAIYQTPEEMPLHPGPHEFRLEKLTPDRRVCAQSQWVQFRVPGDLHDLDVRGREADPSGRTVTWTATKMISSVRITTDTGDLITVTRDRTVTLPSASCARTVKFWPLDLEGNELIPGWSVDYPQPQTWVQLPPFKYGMSGANEVRIRNPNPCYVEVGIRSGDIGRDFYAPANGTQSVFVPDGTYDIFFVYSDRSEELYQGESFTLRGNGVEIQLVKVVAGNYSIRRVK